MPLNSTDVRAAIMNIMPLITDMILANLGGVETTQEPDRPNLEKRRDDQHDDHRDDHQDVWDTMTRDGHGRVRHTNQYSSRVRSTEPTDNVTINHSNRYHDG